MRLQPRTDWVKFCQRCKPYPPQDILTYITAAGILTVHQTNCPSIQDVLLAERAEWRHGTRKLHSTACEILAWDRKELLKEVASAISRHDVNMISVDVQTFTNGTAKFKILLQENDMGVLQAIELDIIDNRVCCTGSVFYF